MVRLCHLRSLIPENSIKSLLEMEEVFVHPDCLPNPRSLERGATATRFTQLYVLIPDHDFLRFHLHYLRRRIFCLTCFCLPRRHIRRKRWRFQHSNESPIRFVGASVAILSTRNATHHSCSLV